MYLTNSKETGVIKAELQGDGEWGSYGSWNHCALGQLDWADQGFVIRGK